MRLRFLDNEKIILGQQCVAANGLLALQLLISLAVAKVNNGEPHVILNAFHQAGIDIDMADVTALLESVRLRADTLPKGDVWLNKIAAPTSSQDDMPQHKISVGQLIRMLSACDPVLPVWFSTWDAMGYGLEQITVKNGVCALHSSPSFGSIAVAELIDRLECIPAELGVALCPQGAEAGAVTPPFEDELDDEPCVCVTTF